MSIVEVIGAVAGGLIIMVVVWKIVRGGVARSNGNVDTGDSAGSDSTWIGGD